MAAMRKALKSMGLLAPRLLLNWLGYKLGSATLAGNNAGGDQTSGGIESYL
jgi:hypothetical protein